MSGQRDSVAVVGRAVRAAHLEARRQKVSALARAVLDAIIDCTATYSRLVDNVAIAQLARYVFDIEEPTGWQRKRVREGCRELKAAGIIIYENKTGRPREGGSYAVVGLPARETHPGTGVCFTETDPDSGVRFPEKVTPVSRESDPGFARNGPDTGGHTEEVSEEPPEERARSREFDDFTDEHDPSLSQEPHLEEELHETEEPSALELAFHHFHSVNKSVSTAEIRALAVKLEQLRLSAGEIVERLNGCTWPSHVDTRASTSAATHDRPAYLDSRVPHCDHGFAFAGDGMCGGSCHCKRPKVASCL
jgi:hypothetical protein